jgi:diguanylate cyclase (GGDEF)-like protein/PAS domain S-box-containing protein
MIAKMNLQFTPYLYIYLFLSIFSFYLAVKSWQELPNRDKVWLTLLLIFGGSWSLLQALEYLHIDIRSKIFWDQFTWVVIPPITALFFLLTKELIGRTKYIIHLSWLLVGVIPLGWLVIVITNGSHHWMWTDPYLVQDQGYVFLEKNYRLGFYLFLIYSCIMIIWGSVVILEKSRKSSGVQATQARWLIFAANIPAVISFLDILFHRSVSFIDPILIATNIFIIVFAWFFRPIRAVDAIKSTENKVIDLIEAPLMLLDDTLRIVELNSIAEEVFSVGRKDVLGQPLDSVSAKLNQYVRSQINGGNAETSNSGAIILPETPFEYFPSLAPIYDLAGGVSSWILLLSLANENDEIQRDYARAYSLVTVLSKVSAAVAATSKTAEVLEVLGAELSQQNIECVYIQVDPDFETSTVQYVSPITKKIKPLELLTGRTFKGYQLARVDWPEITIQAIVENRPLFSENFINAVLPAFAKVNPALVTRGLALVGIGEQTVGVNIPIHFEDEILGVLIIWGAEIQPQDLLPFSVFGSQIGSAITQTRILASEYEKSQQLERANALTSALTRIAAEISADKDAQDVFNHLRDELDVFGFDFSYTTLDLKTDQAVIEYLTIDTKLLDLIQNFSDVSVLNYNIPKIWSEGDLAVFEGGAHVYHPSIRAEFTRLFSGVRKRIIERGMEVVGIESTTPGIILPMSVSPTQMGFLAIWGDTIQNEDLPAFSVFARQIESAIKKVNLIQSVLEQKEIAERSKAVIQGLSEVALKLSSTNQPAEVYAYLGREFRKLGLECFLTLLDETRENLQVHYISYDIRLLDEIERFSNFRLQNFRLPRDKWIDITYQVITESFPVYVADFTKIIPLYFSDFPPKLVIRAIKLLGLSSQTAAYYLPLERGGVTLGTLTTWGIGLSQQDLPAFSIFAHQLSNAIENARLYDQSQKEISERRRVQTKLQVSQQEYRGLFENAHDAIIVFATESLSILDVNARACDIYGYTKAEFLNLTVNNICENSSALYRNLQKRLDQDKYFKYEAKHQTKDQQRSLIVEANMSVVEYDGQPAIQSINRDITERKELEERLQHDALHDELTGIPNRIYFLEHLSQSIARFQRNSDHKFAVLFLDLDHFKGVNDSYGHYEGDRILLETARRLQSCLRKTDTVARFGGDEFVLILDEIDSIFDVTGFCRRVISAVSLPHEIHDTEIVLDACVGVVMSDPTYESAEEYLRDADAALYHAKDIGRGRVEVFDKQLREKILQRVSIEQKLRKAIDADELVMHYQPIIQLQDQKIVGCEALIRWQPPGENIISPGHFIPVAEDSGLIHILGAWILEKACAQLMSWNQKNIVADDFSMSINVSGVQIIDSNFAQLVENIITEIGVNPAQIALEITESAIITHWETATQTLGELANIGVKIHLDDFGTGYSSISFLSQSLFDTIKVERQFLNSYQQGNNGNLIRSIIAFGKDMNLDVIVEGVENSPQADFLRAAGCKYCQGYYFSRPKLPDELQREILSFRRKQKEMAK